jgi:hypothetical protein
VARRVVNDVDHLCLIATNNDLFDTLKPIERGSVHVEHSMRRPASSLMTTDFLWVTHSCVVFHVEHFLGFNFMLPSRLVKSSYLPLNC